MAKKGKKNKPLPYSHPDNPLRKYNEVRSALSEHLRETVPPVPLIKGGYQTILKRVYHENKHLNIDSIANKIPAYVDDYQETTFPIVFEDPVPYYEIRFAIKDTVRIQEIIREDVLNNTYYASNLFLEDEKKVHRATGWDDGHTREFFRWVDSHRDKGLNLFSGSVDLPYLKFTKPQQSADDKTFISEIVIDEDAYRWNDNAIESFLKEYGGKWEDYTEKTFGIAEDKDLLAGRDISLIETPEEEDKKDPSDSIKEKEIQAKKEIELAKIKSEETIKQKKLDDLKGLLKEKIITFDEYLKGIDQIK